MNPATSLLDAALRASRLPLEAEEGGGPSATPARWDLGALYPSLDAWQGAFERARADVARVEDLRARLAAGPEEMTRVLCAVSDLRRAVWRLATYASLLSDEDLREAANLERRQLAQSLATDLAEGTAWLAPEIQALGEAAVEAYIAGSEELKRRFAFGLRETLRHAPHTLGIEAETVLAASGDALSQANSVFDQLVDVDLPYPTLTLEGREVRLTQSEYVRYRRSDDRTVRKAVFDGYWAAHRAFQGTLGANLAAHIMGDEFMARARGFESTLQHALFDDNMPEAVYRTLVAQVNAGLPTLHRYLRLRQRLLGVERLAYYDIYPPLFRLAERRRFSLAQARELALDALEPLGPGYLDQFREASAASWVDSHPRPGKAGGAYMNGSAFDVHPYVLLNHTEDYDSVSTYVHEWGHAMHTLLASANQPFETADYSTFVAETAAISNEILLGDHMVATARTKEEMLFVLGEQLEAIRGTFFRQVQFAEFQLEINEARERGEPLSGASFTERYGRLLRRYYGEAEGVMTIDPLYCIEWAFVAHFYYGYYVWQYATSMAGAALLMESVLADDSGAARARYLAMLEAGGSDHAYALYRRAGVDLAQPEPYQALLRRMNRIIDRIEALID